MDMAAGLNKTLEGTAAGALLGEVGKRMYWPKGIIAQGAEAKAAAVNATIGMTVAKGEVAILPSIQQDMAAFAPHEVVAYAPTAGLPRLRELWQQQMLAKNPALAGKAVSLPVVTPGLTAGISYVADLFLDGARPLLAPNPAWDNYALIVQARRGAQFRQFNAFRKVGGRYVFDVGALEAAMHDEARSGSVRVLLNFPQNPSGYSPTHGEAQQIIAAIKKIADDGAKVLVLCDDAYFGLNYESNIEPQSLFAYLADLHQNVLAVKADGPTKEDFAWGFRCGFLTFGARGMDGGQYDALVKKLMGAIRSSVSCSSTPTQSILIHEFNDPRHEAEKAALKAMLERRYRLVRGYVDSHSSGVLDPLPFNSGYFMSFVVKDGNAEALRQRLLKRGVGVVAINNDVLRVAFSSIDEDMINEAYDAIYQEASAI